MGRQRSGPGTVEPAPNLTDADGGNNPPEAPQRKPPALPAVKTSTASELEHKFITIYGPAGVGKSTLASQWAGGDGFFLNCAGELGELLVFQQSITNWTEFREYAWGYAEVQKEAKTYPCAVIDTADVAGRYCAEEVRRRLGIFHESDAEYGKGWDTLRDTWVTAISKLAAIPESGVVMVAHSDPVRIKTRSGEWDKEQIRGKKAIRESIMDISDIVLFVDFSDEDDRRTIYTKPSRYSDAKERGAEPRLPTSIEWPIGLNGWDIIKAAWEEIK